MANLSKSKWVHLSEEAVSDIQWWLYCAKVFNSKLVINKPTLMYKPTSDASGGSFAAHLGRDWFYGTQENSLLFHSKCNHCIYTPEVPSHHRGNINLYKLISVVLGLRNWGSRMAYHKVTIVSEKWCNHLSVTKWCNL